MATFLLKIHAGRDLSGAVARPLLASQWEGVAVKVPPLAGGGSVGHSNIEMGDTLIIWTHEDPRSGNGKGLTATATVGKVFTLEGREHVLMNGVELIEPPVRLKKPPTGSQVLDYVSRNRRPSPLPMNEQDVSEFWASVARPPSTPNTDAQRVLQANQQEIAAGFARRFATVETRPEQSAFRLQLMGIYRGCCVVSGCPVDTVLQAAHIVPFSENVRYRNDASNGLLLRADLHILFDKSLIAIHPKDNRLVISDDLRGTAYGWFADRLICHHAKREFLQRQYEEFLRRSPTL